MLLADFGPQACNALATRKRSAPRAARRARVASRRIGRLLARFLFGWLSPRRRPARHQRSLGSLLRAPPSRQRSRRGAIDDAPLRAQQLLTFFARGVEIVEIALRARTLLRALAEHARREPRFRERVSRKSAVVPKSGASWAYSAIAATSAARWPACRSSGPRPRQSQRHKRRRRRRACARRSAPAAAARRR